tara:strand:- start:3348 stop:3704 length:357 start_codon:yes stop_codon:yes gene_type:complete
MASLNSKIKLYLEANSKVYKDEMKNYVLYNASDGTGDVIQSWNVAGLTQPTTSELNALDSNADTLESNDIVGTTRENKYGKIGDQLDLLYKDLVAGKLDSTGEWAKKIKAVKDANPKS